MGERGASLLGFFLAIIVVVFVMNIDTFEEIIYDIRGLTRPVKHTSSGFSGGSSLDFSGKKIVETPIVSHQINNPFASQNKLVSESNGFGGSGDKTPQSLSTVRPVVEGLDAGSPTLLVTDGDLEDGFEISGLDKTQITRAPPQEAPGIVFIKCSDIDSPPVLWFVGLTPHAVPIEVIPGSLEKLREGFESLTVRPEKLGVLWYGCSSEVMGQVRQTLSELCMTELGGIMVYDVHTGRQLPMCGL